LNFRTPEDRAGAELLFKRRLKMKKTFWILTFLLVIPGLLLTISCTQKAVKTDSSVSETSPEAGAAATAESALSTGQENNRQQAASNEGAGEKETGLPALAGTTMPEESNPQQSGIQSEMFFKELVLFEYDRSNLTLEAQELLTRKAKYLKKNPDIKVIIEGHCDERGTNEYNLALGERRAEVTRAFLVDLGVPAGRLSTISYGEERPFVLGSNESAWSLNRRAHFVVQ